MGQGAAGLEEPDLGAVADGEVAEGLGDVAFPDADGYPRDLTRRHQCLNDHGVRVPSSLFPGYLRDFSDEKER